MKKYGKIIIIASILIISTVVLYVVNKGINGNKGNDKDNMDIMTVPSRNKIFINGIITPEQSENIFLDATKGSVDTISVKNGQVVEKGAILFTYKNEAVTEQIQSLNREVENSNNQRQKLINKRDELNQELQTKKAEIERLKNQASANSSSEKTVDEREVQAPIIQIDESSLAAIESQIEAYDDQISTLDYQISSQQQQIAALEKKEYTAVEAPIAGTVTLYDDSTSLTNPYITIDSTNLVIKGSVSEKDHFKIAVDQEAKIIILSTNAEVKGNIISISDKPLTVASLNGAESTVSQYEVKLSLDSQKDLVNGYHVQGTVLAKEYTITIPKSSIVNIEGKDYVFKVVDNKLTKQEVTSKNNGDDTVNIESGLKEDDKILVNPTETTEEGTLVE
jgi:HlyD family secretion protein